MPASSQSLFPKSIKERIHAVVACNVCNACDGDDSVGYRSPKYKCPKCRAFYCSVLCCRQHKALCPGISSTTAASALSKELLISSQSGNEKLVATRKNIDSNSDGNTDKLLSGKPTDDGGEKMYNSSGDPNAKDDGDDNSDDDSSLEDGWKITDEMKNTLRNSKWLRNELKDGGLREMIAALVSSEEKHNTIHRRRKGGEGRKSFDRYGQMHKRMKQQHHDQRKQQNDLQVPINSHDELVSKRHSNPKFDVFLDKLLVLSGVLERSKEDKGLKSHQRVIFSAKNLSGAPATEDIGIIPPAFKCSADDGTIRPATTSMSTEEDMERWLNLPWICRPDLALKPIVKKAALFPKFEPVDVPSSASDSEDDEDENDQNVVEDTVSTEKVRENIPFT